MANICENTFYACSEDPKNIEYIKEFLGNNFEADVDWDNDYVNAYFDSKWTFPEELMNDMYDNLPNKEDIYMRCLSIEYGCLYHALLIADENGGWREV